MIAGLPMYDRPELAEAHRRYWQEIRRAFSDRGIATPQNLTRDISAWDLWQRPDLVLSQTCGMPYRSVLHGRVTLIATPEYDLPCPAGHYFSILVTRRDDPRRAPAAFDGARLAFNDDCSQSGWAAPLDWAAKAGIKFGGFLDTGAHINSAHAVANGQADIAAIDAVTWELLKRYDPVAKALSELDATQPTPALPYISALGGDEAAMASALKEAVASISAADRQTLCLRDFARIEADSYLAVATPARLND